MRRNKIYFFIFIIQVFCLSCNQSSKSTRITNNGSVNKEIDILSIDASENSIELNTISDMDFSLSDTLMQHNLSTCYRLLDVYNAAVVMNSLITDFDLQLRFGDEHENVLKAIEHIDLSHVKDAETLSKLCNYKQEMLYLLTVDSDTIDRELHNPWAAKNILYRYISDKYNVKTFAPLNLDTLFYKYKHCSSVPDWENLWKRRGESGLTVGLEERYRKANDFDARCIYAIELAHAYEADFNSWTESVNPAISKMESLMNEQHFSYYLFEIWQKWRVLYQEGKGSSKDSEIPNYHYNKYRRICAETIFRYISDFPEDIIAINEFLLLSCEGNVLREGIYEYGNQNAVDKYELFEEKYKDDAM